MKIDKKKAIYDEAKFLSNLVFYEDSEFSKVKSKKGYTCEECDGTGVIFVEDEVGFCSRRKKINTYNSALIASNIFLDVFTGFICIVL